MLCGTDFSPFGQQVQSVRVVGIRLWHDLLFNAIQFQSHSRSSLWSGFFYAVRSSLLALHQQTARWAPKRGRRPVFDVGSVIRAARALPRTLIPIATFNQDDVTRTHLHQPMLKISIWSLALSQSLSILVNSRLRVCPCCARFLLHTGWSNFLHIRAL